MTICHESSDLDLLNQTKITLNLTVKKELGVISQVLAQKKADVSSNTKNSAKINEFIIK